jgi:hypothetical protein
MEDHLEGSDVAHGGPGNVFGAVGVGVVFCPKMGVTVARTVAKLNFFISVDFVNSSVLFLVKIEAGQVVSRVVYSLE